MTVRDPPPARSLLGALRRRLRRSDAARAASAAGPPASPRAFAGRWLEHHVPATGAAGAQIVVWALAENCGEATWHRDPSDGPQVRVRARAGLSVRRALLLRSAVAPGERAAFAVRLALPERCGVHRVRLDLVARGVGRLGSVRLARVDASIDVRRQERAATEALLELSSRRNPFFFTPTQGIRRGHDGFAYPLFADRASGCRITDVEGREFVDVLMGWGCSLLGYSEPRIQEAIARAARTGAGVLSLPHRLELEASEALCSRFPFGDEVLYGKNGSDVTTWAVRVARVATGRRTVLFAGYHGWQDWYAATQGFEASGVPPGNNPYNVLLPYRDAGALERALALHDGDVAAVMTDPAHTSIELDDPRHERDGPYLRRMQALARRAGALFILDEIMTGFRFRSGSAQAAYGLAPDLTCLGKALGNGMPLSALVSAGGLLRRHVGRIFYAPTMKGEVTSFAAAREALRIHAEEDVPSPVWATGERIRGDVDGICRRLGLDAALVGAPYRMFLRFGDLGEEEDVLARTLLQQELTRRGVVSYRGFVILSRAHDGGAVDRISSAFEGALRAVAERRRSGRFLPGLDVPEVVLERRVHSRLAADRDDAASPGART